VIDKIYHLRSISVYLAQLRSGFHWELELQIT
jgi:hypothetical protein